MIKAFIAMILFVGCSQAATCVVAWECSSASTGTLSCLNGAGFGTCVTAATPPTFYAGTEEFVTIISDASALCQVVGAQCYPKSLSADCDSSGDTTEEVSTYTSTTDCRGTAYCDSTGTSTFHSVGTAAATSTSCCIDASCNLEEDTISGVKRSVGAKRSLEQRSFNETAKIVSKHLPEALAILLQSQQ
eukprot:TRINITY_DN3368_c0_g1_i1.p1 TRINITY_DN3368_c0_g1~~TRINITY_DN3368_c0_g1_i1.p1  ORF type:complete len:189 (-),score=37.92 TRINITY_DN3368_c0_g1_i1:6-572(-)